MAFQGETGTLDRSGTAADVIENTILDCDSCAMVTFGLTLNVAFNEER